MRAAYRATVVVPSDKASRGERVDETGPAVKAMLEGAGFAVDVVIVLPDDRESIARTLRACCDDGAAFVATAGGTGFSPRDCTPEATLDVAERLAPGLAEAMRAASLALTPRAILGRGVAVIRGRTLIVNLPGSPRGACENLAVILPALEHGLDILRETGGECAREAAPRDSHERNAAP